MTEPRSTYPGRAAQRPKASAPVWIPLYFEGLSGPGWQGFQLDLGLASQLQQRGEVATVDEGREVLWDLRRSFERAREEHAASLEVDALADEDEQLPLFDAAPVRRRRGKVDHPPPPLEQLLGAVRPSGARRRRGVKGGKPGKTDAEVAEYLSWIHKHRGRGLSDEDIAYQDEWTVARALTKRFFLSRATRANHQPSVPPSIARRLPEGRLVQLIVGWLIYADVCRCTGITCPAPVWARTLDCSEGGWWKAWAVVERLGLGISMRRYHPSPREENGVTYGSPVSYDDNWYGVGPELAKLRSVYLPEAQLELDLRAESKRTGTGLEELRTAHRQRRQLERDEALRKGRRQQARIRRLHHRRAARRRGDVVVPRGSAFLHLREYVLQVAATERRVSPLRDQLAELQADHRAEAAAYWLGGATGDLPLLEGFPRFWSLAQTLSVSATVIAEPRDRAASGALAVSRHLHLPEAEQWLAQPVEIQCDSGGSDRVINAVNSVDGIPASLVGCEIEEVRAHRGLTAAGAVARELLTPRRSNEARAAPQGLQDKGDANGDGDLGAPWPRSLARPVPPTRSTPPPRAPPADCSGPMQQRGAGGANSGPLSHGPQQTDVAAGLANPTPRSTSPPATVRSAADQQLAQDLERVANPEMRARLAAWIRAVHDPPEGTGRGDRGDVTERTGPA